MTLSEFFNAVQAALPARRGNLYEQYLERAGADGKMNRYGPYYVWTRCENGKMVSSRVSREDAPRVREEIAQGKVLNGLIEQLWKLSEELAQAAERGKKKKFSKSTRRRVRLSPKP
jgi:hypothetical protein